MTFDDFFQNATATEEEKRKRPFEYQRRLSEEPWPDLLDIPTGLGKTAAVVLAWIYKRCVLKDNETPRRLVYCLPMRVLVEQTKRSVDTWVQKLCDAGILTTETVSVHLLMGGEVDRDWALYPEADAILIGTQDMLLSRALNRGYAAGRARWPMEFGLLNNDCLWVFDEVQLMSTGLATSLQLDAWRRMLCLRESQDGFPVEQRNPVYRPCRSLWMSATMAKHWLESAVDWQGYVDGTWDNNRNRLQLEQADYEHPRVHALYENAKILQGEPIAKLEKPKSKGDKTDISAKTLAYIEKLSDAVVQHHSADGLTLVILNTVDRAKALYQRLKNRLGKVDVHLVHSRFRPMEREAWLQFLAGSHTRPRVIISTQVVEAGVDISATVLFTELAPWACLVQRFGRCARYPYESGKIFWMDLSSDEAYTKPYSYTEMQEAKKRLSFLNGDAGLASLREQKRHLDGDKHEAATLLPYNPSFVPRDKDLFELFDTTADLTGADVDISRFIRDGEELDVQVFWRHIGDGESPGKKDRSDRRELCPVPFYELQRYFSALPRPKRRIWRWDYLRGWERLGQDGTDRIYPGQVFLLDKSCGGYDRTKGWTGRPDDMEFDLLPEIGAKQANQISSKIISQDAEEDTEALSEGGWLSILEHSQDLSRKLQEILDGLLLPSSDTLLKILRLSARWHDRGKGHGSFKAKLKPEYLVQSLPTLKGQPPAKAPKEAWRTPAEMTASLKPVNPSLIPQDIDRRRPGFRHELASALAIMETVRRAYPAHPAFAWPDGLEKGAFGEIADPPEDTPPACPAVAELADLSKEQFDLLLYLVAAHHGKVRMSLRSSPDDSRTDVPDPSAPNKRQARGVRDGDQLESCEIPSSHDAAESPAAEAQAVTLRLDPMEMGLSVRYGPSWRERTQNLLEQMGPFRLAYLEALLRSADCRASRDEEPSVIESTPGA